MISNVIFEMCLEGSVSCSDRDISHVDRYPMMLMTVKVKDKFEVWFKSGTVRIKCFTVRDEIDSRKYINLVMKIAMKNELIYQLCMFCHAETFFPFIKCKKCGALLDIEDVDWYVETKIEKIPKHLGFFNKNVYINYRPSKRYNSPILCPKTTQKLRNL
jgi:ribosomal protein L40E